VWPLGIAACALLASAIAVAQTPTRAPASHWRVPRMADGRPDLQGTWTNNTATPLVRPRDFAAKQYFTEEEAAEFERTLLAQLRATVPDGDRLGSDLSEVWFDRPKVVPDRRTSLVVQPDNGALPPLVPAARDRIAARPSRITTIRKRDRLASAASSARTSAVCRPGRRLSRTRSRSTITGSSRLRRT
jgi:hypothetical protein